MRWSWPGDGMSVAFHLAIDTGEADHPDREGLGVSEACLRRWMRVDDVDPAARAG